jgi:alpha-1,6-mannosyltransferase
MTAAILPSSRRELYALTVLFAIGCAMLAFVTVGPWIIGSFGYGVFIPAVAASGFLTIAATRFSTDAPVRVGLLVVLGFALAMRLLLVAEEPFLSTDLYRYIWDGRVQAAGINPYRYVPADPALAALRDAAIYPRINRADYAVTAYPPIAEMFFFFVTRVSESAIAMRLAMVACEIAIVAALIDLLRRFKLPPVTVAAYAWHPLAIWEIANNGHAEALMVALMMVGVWLLIRAKPVAGSIAIALAALVKPYAVFALPAFWRRWDWRVPLAVIVTVILCYLPYLSAGRGVFGFLGGYAAEEGMTSGEGIWLTLLIQTLIGKIPGLIVLYVLVAAAIMIWLGLRASHGDSTPHESLSDIILLLTAGLVLMSPNYAWYFLALVPFIPLGAGAPAWALTIGAFLLYRPIFLPYNDLTWKTLATAPFLLTLAFVMYRRGAEQTRSAPLSRTEAASAAATAKASLVIPCLNEEDAIGAVVREVLAQGVHEVIVVDNGSTDATAPRAREAGGYVVSEPMRGYGRACAAGLRAVSADAEIVCFLDGDGSDVPAYFADVVAPIVRGEADFVMGSRLRGRREPGSMTPQQLVAGRLAGLLMRLVYGVRFTDMSPFRAMRVTQLRNLGMSEPTCGWNLEMQMRVAAAGLRIREVPVDHRCRRGGVSKVSGNATAGLSAAWKIATTFVRLAATLRRAAS